ncbi:hypothetical protein HanIR_Chr04g0193581 [Helianthus annuus]|nr:hypothetical protein HanIR_Chr04g0193581 [Helianthus annuus]
MRENSKELKSAWDSLLNCLLGVCWDLFTVFCNISHAYWVCLGVCWDLFTVFCNISHYQWQIQGCFGGS